MYNPDGTPMPKQEHFFRKAVEMYGHNNANGHITDTVILKKVFEMDKPVKQQMEL